MGVYYDVEGLKTRTHVSLAKGFWFLWELFPDRRWWYPDAATCSVRPLPSPGLTEKWFTFRVNGEFECDEESDPVWDEVVRRIWHFMAVENEWQIILHQDTFPERQADEKDQGRPPIPLAFDRHELYKELEKEMADK